MERPGKTPLVPMAIIGTMYVVLGFSVGINAFFIPFVQEAFTVSTAASYLIMTATFSAYVLFGVPSGVIIKNFGYKGGIGIAFLIMGLGFSLIGYSAEITSFTLFLFALFIIGMGQTLLTGAINSYVTLLGPEESAASRICVMGIADKLALAGASLILGIFLDLTEVRLSDAITPFYIITGLLVVLAVLARYSPLPELKAIGEDITEVGNEESAYANTKTSIFQIPHLLLGVVAIFFDVGVEIVALGSANDYAKVLGLPSPENYVWYPTFGMVAGYILGFLFIPRLVSQRTALTICCVVGILVTLLLVTVPAEISIYFVGLLGFANSLLWPAIFPLALSDLGKFTKTGSSVLVMGIIGGALLPLGFGYLAGLFNHQLAYLICIPSYLYILYFALYGSKIRVH
ncbi:MAG: glucose/galactose MFS transporter [Cytophagaceae bacterium SCN 52-12]|nr:MAG: glucose/galactose MFS transporter [Cytophagaceae bacterium SCN 52-12]